ncbi:hypothetical protein ACFWIO_12775 [Streptomyces diastatochromogenes]|uniref:hypothetical protein n=1 Tax=Streptomyces diastatochromogenes TaxID=42236 RepID=UPI0036545FE3
MTAHLEEITPRNLEAALAIRIRPDQEHAVEPVAHSLAEAYVHRAGLAWPRLIVDGDRPVGFLMAFLDIDWREDGSAIRSGFRKNGETSGGQTVGVLDLTWKGSTTSVTSRAGRLMTAGGG